MKHKSFVLALILALGCLAHAEDKKLDPTGTWKWRPANPDGRTVEINFTLKLQGQALTGAVIKSTGTTAITNGVLKGNQVSFQTIREAKGGKGITTYTGTLNGDTIKGKVIINASGKELSADWEVKRETARPKKDEAK
jgi:hypothetical protein